MTDEAKKPITGEDFTKVLRDLTDPIIEKWWKEGINHYLPTPTGFIPGKIEGDSWAPIRHWDD